MENFILLPDTFAQGGGLERWLEGQHEVFQPNSAIIHALYARYNPKPKDADTYPVLDQPYILDIAFNPKKDDYKITVKFSILGTKKADSLRKSAYDLIEVVLEKGEFNDIEKHILEAIKRGKKDGFEYNTDLLDIKIKYRPEGGEKPALVELVNNTVIDRKDYAANIYGAKIIVESPSGFNPFKSNRAKLSYKYVDTLYALSRYSSFNYYENEGIIETTRIPSYSEHKIKTSEFDFDFTYKILSTCDVDRLEKLFDIINARIDDKISKLRKLHEQKMRENEVRSPRIKREFEKDVKRLNEERSQLKLGLSKLKEDKELLEAFRLLNQTFLMRSNSLKKGDSKNEGWYSFQLTFILSQLPTLSEDQKTLTVLNFPTGMGKTEAFLGFAILKILYERLKSTNNGTSVVIKYPRKLLSRQQLDRALKLVSFANAALFGKHDDKVLLHPISLGTLFNSEDTPNRYVDTKTYKDISPEFEKWVKDPINKPIQVKKCPYCDKEVKVVADRKDLRIRFICRNSACVFSTKLDYFFQHQNGEIPLYVGDDEVLRYLPSILITTIDKFSSFTVYNPNFKCLFLDDRVKCDTKYGFYFIEDQFKHFTSSLSGTSLDKSKISKYFRPPSLFIVDEIHLVTGAYASKFSIMENTFFDLFNMKGKNPPKIICSSATVNQTFNGQMFIYQSDFRAIFKMEDPEKIFLYPVFLDVFTEEKPTVGRLIKTIMPGNFSKYLAVEHATDYFIKEFEKLNDEQKKYYATVLYYFKAKAKLERVRGSVDERVIKLERKGRRMHINPHTDIEFSTDRDQSKMTEDQTYLDGKINSDNKQLDLVYATNTIANGLDISAFNVMYIFGFPNRISEYIQARSRIARRENTGLCILFLEQKDLRDASVFYDFYDLHKNIGLAIEGDPTNSEAKGVIENMLKKLFHLAIQIRYDTTDAPFYRIRTIDRVLHSDSELGEINRMTYEWMDFEEDSDTSRRFFDEIWKTYIDNYKRWINAATPRTIYDDKTGKIVPQPTLIDISHQIDIRLASEEMPLASMMGTTVLDPSELPNESGDDEDSVEDDRND